MQNTQAVCVVDGSRSPFLKAIGKPGPFAAADLAVAAGRPLLMRQPFTAEQFDEVILGCVAPSADEANIARVVSLRLGCGDAVPAWTVQRNCASGMQALDAAATNSRRGRSNLVVAGGVESMSYSPVWLNNKWWAWRGQGTKAKSVGAKLSAVAALR